MSVAACWEPGFWAGLLLATLYIAWTVLPDACRLVGQAIRLLGLACLCMEEAPVALVATVLNDSYIFWTTTARLAAMLFVIVFLRVPICLWHIWRSPPRRLKGRPTASHRAYLRRQRRPKCRRIQQLRVLLNFALIAGAFASAPEAATLSGCNTAGGLRSLAPLPPMQPVAMHPSAVRTTSRRRPAPTAAAYSSQPQRGAAHGLLLDSGASHHMIQESAFDSDNPYFRIVLISERPCKTFIGVASKQHVIARRMADCKLMVLDQEFYLRSCFILPDASLSRNLLSTSKLAREGINTATRSPEHADAEPTMEIQRDGDSHPMIIVKAQGGLFALRNATSPYAGSAEQLSAAEVHQRLGHYLFTSTKKSEVLERELNYAIKDTRPSKHQCPDGCGPARAKQPSHPRQGEGAQANYVIRLAADIVSLACLCEIP